MDVMHIVGNRPQFIKLAPVSRELRRRNIDQGIIHTGQHYDADMSDIFFEELKIPKPVRNLNVGSGTHAQITGTAIIRIEEALLEYQPKCVIVYGDTNSTLAAALAAAKLCIPVIHVEAGLRIFEKKNPEECNRLVVDHIADFLCSPDKICVDNLIKEGISGDKIFFTGDVMYDQFLYCLNDSTLPEICNDCPDGYILMTWHRQENTCSREKMEQVISFIERVGHTVILPLHPRTSKLLKQYDLEERVKKIPFLKVIHPVSYKEMVSLLSYCRLLISDSGGASKEASFVGKKCIYILNFDVWGELIKEGYIQSVDMDNEKSVGEALEEIRDIVTNGREMKRTNVFGDGTASVKIADIITGILGGNDNEGK